MNYQCLIIDDEPIARKILADYIAELEDVEIVGQCKTALEASNLLNRHTVDILFLDINMPKLSGIQFLKSLKQAPLAIFTTAYSEYAVEAFELEAFDYLVKPIAFDRFLKAVNNAKKRLEERQSNSIKTTLLIVKEGKRIYRVPFEVIFLIQAYGDYIRIHTAEKVYITKRKLNTIHMDLPPNFLQVHRSYIINVNYLKYLEGNMIMVHKEKIPISARYKEGLMQWL